MRTSFFVSLLVMLVAVTPASAQFNFDPSVIQPITIDAEIIAPPVVEVEPEPEVLQVDPVIQAEVIPSVEWCRVTDQYESSFNVPGAPTREVVGGIIDSISGDNSESTMLYVVYEAAYQKVGVAGTFQVVRENGEERFHEFRNNVVEDGNALTPEEDGTYFYSESVDYVDGEYVFIDATIDGVDCEAFAIGSPNVDVGNLPNLNQEPELIEVEVAVPPVQEVAPEEQPVVDNNIDPQTPVVQPGAFIAPPLADTDLELADFMCRVTASVTELSDGFIFQYGVAYTSPSDVENAPVDMQILYNGDEILNDRKEYQIQEGSNDLVFRNGQIIEQFRLPKNGEQQVEIRATMFNTLAGTSCTPARLTVLSNNEAENVAAAEREAGEDDVVIAPNFVDEDNQAEAAGDDEEGVVLDAQADLGQCRILAQGTMQGDSVLIGAVMRLAGYDNGVYPFYIEAIQESQPENPRFYAGEYQVDGDELLLNNGAPFAFTFNPANDNDRLTLRATVGETVCPIVRFSGAQFAQLVVAADEPQYGELAAAVVEENDEQNVVAQEDGQLVVLPSGLSEEDEAAAAALTIFVDNVTEDGQNERQLAQNVTQTSQTLGTLYVVIAGLLFLIVILVVGFVYMLGRHHNDHL